MASPLSAGVALGNKRVPRTRAGLLGLLLAVLFAFEATAAPALAYRVIHRYPHPEMSFTQGLELDGDTVLESSGLYRRSYIQRWRLDSQQVIARRELPAAIFAEGLTQLGGRIYVLSWREQKALVFDKTTLAPLGEHAYRGEGWGLTHNGSELIMSNGSDSLQFIDAATFQVLRTLPVTDDGSPLAALNELEWIPATPQHPTRLLANIWLTDTIVVIDPDSGAVTARLDLSKLYPKGQRSRRADVLNGIAYDPRDGTLLVTGKFWPHVYKLKLEAALR